MNLERKLRGIRPKVIKRFSLKTLCHWLSLSLLINGLFFEVGCKRKQEVLSLPYMIPFRDLSKDAFAIVLLSSIEGYVEPCGCTSNPLGGLARFATIFDHIKAALQNRIALIDSGNLLFPSITANLADLCQDEARTKLLVSNLARLGLTTTLVGPLDNARGTYFYEHLYRQYGIKLLLPIEKADKEVRIDLLKLIHTPSYDIGLLGIAHDEQKTSDLSARIQALVSNLKKTSPKLKIVIALSQMPEARTKEIFNGMKEIDIVIQGQITSPSPALPIRLKDQGPLFIEGGRQGQYFDVIVLQNVTQSKIHGLTLDNRAFEKNAREELLTARIAALGEQAKNAPNTRADFLNKRLTIAEDELKKLKQTDRMPPLSEPSLIFYTVALTKKIDPNPSVKKQTMAYEKSIPLLVKRCEENIECPKPLPNQASYVGVEVCKNCHQEALSVWHNAVFSGKSLDEQGQEITRSVGHSKAWRTLVAVHKDADRSCIGCHSVGFMESGGYCKTSEVGPLKDVQCESCHGPGSLHVQSGGDKRFIQRKVSEDTCRSCHHVPHIESYKSFDYEQKMMKILGKGHGESLLRELEHRVKNTVR
jgi:hypothetical protein